MLLGTNLPLIGLKGRRNAGKDTIAKVLMRDFGYVRQAFADNLKGEMYCAFGRALLEARARTAVFDHGELFNPESIGFNAWMYFVDGHKNDPPDSEFGWLGPMLQYWGTEYRRNMCGEDYWLRVMEPLLAPGVVITDVRFPNEADLIRGHGGWIVHVERPGAQEDGAARSAAHPSEALLASIPADYVIHNNATFDDLIVEVHDLIPYLEALGDAPVA